MRKKDRMGNNSDFENQLRAHLDRIPRAGPGGPALPEKVRRVLADYICRGGKRMRPRLFLAAVHAYGRPVDTACRQLAVALELLHQFAVIHDDIVDRACYRRGAPAAHCRFNALLHNTALTGTDMALAAGDWLFAHAMRLVAELPIPARKSIRIMRLVAGAAETAALGQAAELCAAAGLCRLNAGRALRLFAAKTASYSFACPLQAAAVLADKPEIVLSMLADAGRWLGQAYQIRDDLDDFAPGAPPNPHLHITLPYLMLLEQAGVHLGKTPACSRLRAKIEAAGITHKCRCLIRKLTRAGYARLASAGLPADIIN